MGGTTLVRDEPVAAPHPDGPAPPPPPTGKAPNPRRARPALLGLLVALFLAALEQLTVATALPTIAGDLHALDRMTWPVTASLLTAAVGLPVHGRLGDRLGRKGVLQCAILIFVVGSALAGHARSMDQLIAFRALQGLGAGGLLTGVQTLAADLVPTRRRGRCTGIVGTVLALASLAGPPLGGYLTDHLSWRWCFYAEIPVGLLALALVAFAPKVPKPRPGPRLDVLGALLLTAAATCLVLLAGWGGTRHAWDSGVVVGLAAGAAAAVILFVLAEGVATDPLVPLRLFRDPVFTVSGLVGLITGAALSGAVSCLPAYLQLTDGASATGAGLLMLPLTGGIVGASVLGGRLVHHTGHYRIYPALGSALTVLGTWLLSRLDTGTPRLTYCLWTAVLGAGIGLVTPVLVLAVQNAARPADLTTATGAHSCLRQLGGAVGAALFGALLTGRLTDTLADRLPAPEAAGLPDPRSLTPHLVHTLPPALHDAWTTAYADALPGILPLLVPALLLGLLAACFLKETPLPTGAPARPTAETEPVTVTARIPQARTPYPAGVPVSGTVRHHDGTAVPHAALTLIDSAGTQVGRGASGEDGRYALSTPGTGAYVLIAAAGGHRPQAVTVAVAERPVELDVLLGGAGRLTGTVVTADGTAVPDAVVTLANAHGEVVASTRSDRVGDYTVTGLIAGAYTLAASAPAFRPSALPVTVTASLETRQDIELAGGSVVRGTVRDDTGRPVVDARVTLLDAAGAVLDTLTTGPDGTFRFVDLASGEYTVIATGYPPVATVLKVAGGGRTERDVRLGHED
ncbi:DHA2 family efflux MFS transporter permease subunit [Streptomyces sp. NPDC005820]|uniref:MFS transporter n=1 Tax=Streptomyces sp. NPDC005820 TaxID=3157069 RepID=UPI0033FFDF6E